ncbi:hypothetical protein QBC37DRAFT_410778 [Rhypophila decipiens]|uniref:Uncharacterized protein n=1 Tax=Rhypophila decipiens TaxID=261697 RepID=A0AAN6YHC3_9PEZI|nr:hypothetical protein QBC37DRAFT_410778 [Rhypophila decipiens]
MGADIRIVYVRCGLFHATFQLFLILLEYRTGPCNGRTALIIGIFSLYSYTPSLCAIFLRITNTHTHNT